MDCFTCKGIRLWLVGGIQGELEPGQELILQIHRRVQHVRRAPLLGESQTLGRDLVLGLQASSNLTNKYGILIYGPLKLRKNL